VASEVKFLEVQNYMHQREFAVAQQKLQITQLEQELQAAKVDLDASGIAYNADQADMGAGVAGEEIRMSSVPVSMNETERSLWQKQAAYEVASYHARSQYAKEQREIDDLQDKIAECVAAIRVLKAELAEKYIRAPLDGIVSDPL